MAVRGILLISTLVAGSISMQVSNAYAQVTGAPTRDELESRTLPDIARRNTKLTVEGGIERAPCPLADPQYNDIRIEFSNVEFTNLRGLSPADLEDSWREFTGRSISVAQLCEIRDRAATILRHAGYLAAVQVVPQRIGPGGTVKFDVLMAKLVHIQVRGDAGASERKIVGYLKPLTGQEVFNAVEAERALLLARDLPGFDVRLTLRPAGSTPGDVIGEVTIVRHKFELEGNIQNYGSRDTGRFGQLITAKINGITGMGDQTTFSIFTTSDFKEQIIAQAGHSFLVGNDGLRISGDFTYAWTSPELNPPAPIDAETLVANFNASYPLIRRQSRNLMLSAGFDLIDQDIKFGPITLTRDRLRILYSRLDFEQIDPDSLASRTGYSTAEPKWRYGGNIELRQGISALGASKDCGTGLVNCLPPFTPLSHIDADPTAFVVRAQSYFDFRPKAELTFSLAVRGQYAPNALASYEEFSVGNYTIGRSYDSGTLLGDSGVGARAEVRFFKLQPNSDKDLAVQPFLFFDAAHVWNKDRLAPPYLPGGNSLYSAGSGLNLAWGSRSRISMMAAIPLKTAGLLVRKGDVRALISVTTKIIPWRR